MVPVNRYEWIRLLVPAGELQMIRATKEPAEIATRGTVLKIAREVYDDINPDDNIPFYEEFVKDLNELEGKTGTLGFNSELRNRLVTFIAENYIPKAAGKVICPACLTETPNNLAICVKCTGSLISFGERTSPYPEAESPGEPRPEQPQDADVGDEDVHMDKDEIDRLVKETKAKNASEEHEDVNMEEDAEDDGEEDEQPRPSRPSPQREKTAAEEEQEKREAEADREQEEADAQEEANRMDTGHWTYSDAGSSLCSWQHYSLHRCRHQRRPC
eukprot:s3679_g3.t1